MREKIIIGAVAAGVTFIVITTLFCTYMVALSLMRYQPEITAAIAPAWLLRKAYLEFFTI
jgi:hypothetical protein